MNILVVDDESTNVQDIVNRIQKMPNFSGRVLGANSGKDALRILEYFKPDLLIADISTPGTDEHPLLSIVHEHGMCRDCIILTASEDFQHARQAVQYHATDYLLKPIDWDMLESSIDNLISKADTKRTVDSVLAGYSDIFVGLDKPDLSYSLKRVLKYINTKYTCDISLTKLSIYSGMSENSLCNMFKRELEMTFLEYIYKLRLKKAIEIMLIDQKKPIKEVSQLVGYKSERQFFRMFKSKLGLTPQQFRQKTLYEQVT